MLMKWNTFQCAEDYNQSACHVWACRSQTACLHGPVNTASNSVKGARVCVNVCVCLRELALTVMCVFVGADDRVAS